MNCKKQSFETNYSDTHFVFHLLWGKTGAFYHFNFLKLGNVFATLLGDFTLVLVSLFLKKNPLLQ